MSIKINFSTWRSCVGFTVGLIAILSLAEVPIPVVMTATIAVLVQTITGAYVYARVPRTESPTIPEFLGMGFAIGSALSTLCDIFLKSTPIKSVAWLIPTIVIVLVVAERNVNKNRRVFTRIQETKYESTELLAIVVIAFLYLAHDFVWYISLFASGLCILIAIYVRDHYRTRGLYLRYVIALTTLATSSLLAGIRFRSPFWWINSDDYQLFESLQVSLARYGPRDQLGATGISITSYHFLSYAWTGLIDRVSAAPTWVVLNRITPVIVSVALSSLVWSFISREGVQRPKLRFLLACLYPILFVFTFGSPSSAYGLIFLLAALFYWTDRHTEVIHWSRIPMGALLTVFVIGTKISNAPIIFLGLGALALIGFARNQSGKWVSLTDLLVATTTGALYYFLLLQYTTTTTSMELEPFGFAKQIFGDLNELNGASLIVIGVIASSAYMFIPLFGVVTFWSDRQSRYSKLGILALPMFPLLAIYIFFIGGHGASASYFMGSALSVLLLITLLAASKPFKAIDPNTHDMFQLKFFSVAGLVAGFASNFLLEQIDSGGRTAMFGRAVASAYWILLVVIGIFWFIQDIGKPRKSRHQITLTSLVLVGTICASATVAAINLYEVARQPNMTKEIAESVIGTPDEIAAGNWIKSHVPVDSLIASNHFCAVEDCFGANWFNNQIELFNKNPKFLKEKCPRCEFTLFGGSNMILPAYAERRFLIQGPRFLWGLNDPPAWAIDRMNATLGFANNPSIQTMSALRNFDVEYFVVDLELTARKTWLPFGRLIYQNQSFVILKLIEVQ